MKDIPSPRSLDFFFSKQDFSKFHAFFINFQNNYVKEVQIYQVSHPTFYLSILTQRANATVDCFANSVRLVHVFTLMFP